jgi:hypothetical protein
MPVVKFTPKSEPMLLRCTACGETAEAACTCGVAYEAAGVRAARGVATSPEKSSRAIAEETKTGKSTVMRARIATVPNGTVETDDCDPPVTFRVGRDGKARVMPKPRGVRFSTPPCDETNEPDGDVSPGHTQEYFDKMLKQIKVALRAYPRSMKQSQKLAFYREVIKWVTAQHNMQTPSHIEFYRNIIADLTAIIKKAR